MKPDREQVSAMLPAHARIEQTLETLARLKACDPPPAEILVHLATSQVELRQKIEAAHPEVRIILSEENLGPGGGRNKMLAAAEHELIASFDDDSYPRDPDFFARLPAAFQQLPQASILALNVHEPGRPHPPDTGEAKRVAHFIGCGCAYRRSHFLEGEGYVPIPIAYSMEEADLALRYTARKREIWNVPWLCVFHDTILSHHATARVAAMQVANTALFAFLRYPFSLWPLGLAQLAHKWLDTLQRGRFKGFLWAPFLIPVQCWHYRRFRGPVPASVIKRQRSF